MKTIGLQDVSGNKVFIFVNKICAVMETKTGTNIFVIGDGEPFQTYTHYCKVMEKIEEIVDEC